MNNERTEQGRIWDELAGNEWSKQALSRPARVREEKARMKREVLAVVGGVMVAGCAALVV